jgi:uncharacterized protein
MDKNSIIEETRKYVEQELTGEGSGHDWYHIERVWNLAKRIGLEEGCDMYIVEMSALLHDIGDPKLYAGDTTVAPRMIGAWLDKMSVDSGAREHIMHIIGHMSFSKSLEGKITQKSKEFMVVQDADRLDALGAVGIARCLVYSGHKGRPIWNPSDKIREGMSVEEYRGDGGSAIGHFYEKLFKLKDQMNTATGKRLAEGRHSVMELYVEQLMSEWEGEL